VIGESKPGDGAWGGDGWFRNGRRARPPQPPEEGGLRNQQAAGGCAEVVGRGGAPAPSRDHLAGSADVVRV